MIVPHANILRIMSIRAFSPSDLPAVLEIYAQSKLDELSNETHVPTLIPLNLDDQRFNSFNRSIVCVYESTCVLGYGARSGNEITALFVHPAGRGQGVGRALLEHLLAQLPGHCHLHVAASNTAAISLYQQYGFAVSASFVANYNGLPISAATMRRPAVALAVSAAGSA